METKVLHILNSASYSGAENVVIAIIKNTSDEICSIYMSPDGQIRDTLKEKNIEYYSVPKLSIKNIKKAIKEIGPDIIHAHDFTAGMLSALSTYKVPIISHIHNNPPWIKRFSLKTIGYGICCLRFRKILTVSSSVMDEFIFGKYFASKTEVIGNPVDVSEIRSRVKINYIQETEDMPESVYDIVFVGRLTDQKNPLFFLDIIREVEKEKKNLYVAMVGDGPLKDTVQAKICETGLERNVEMCGFQNNPYIYMANSRLLCIPSLWEGFGLVAVEAMVFSKPVVASAVGGLPKIVDSTCGNLCCSKEEFVTEILRLLNDKSYYKRKSHGAILKAKNLDNLQNFIIRIEKIYNELLSSKI